MAKEELEEGATRGEKGWSVLVPEALEFASPRPSPVPDRLGQGDWFPFSPPEHLGLHQT